MFGVFQPNIHIKVYKHFFSYANGPKINLLSKGRTKLAFQTDRYPLVSSDGSRTRQPDLVPFIPPIGPLQDLVTWPTQPELCEYQKWKEQQKLSRTARFQVCSAGNYKIKRICMVSLTIQQLFPIQILLPFPIFARMEGESCNHRKLVLLCGKLRNGHRTCFSNTLQGVNHNYRC